MGGASSAYLALKLAKKNDFSILKKKPLRIQKNKWTGEERQRMFDNVLKFPKGTDHLKYFDKNPHPDKIPDKELAIYEAFNRARNNAGKIDVHKTNFENVRKLLYPQLSEFEKKLLTLPDIIQNEIDAGGEEDYINLLTHLRDSFYKYFSTSTKKEVIPPIQWIDYGFVSRYLPAKSSITDLDNNLYNNKAKENIIEKLKDAGAFNNKDQEFYLWNTSPYNWDAMSFQARPVKWEDFSFVKALLSWKTLYNLGRGFSDGHWTMPNPILPDQYGALGNFTINALPEGRIISKGNDLYDICLDKMYYFVNDPFNFEGTEYLWQWRLYDNPNSKNIDWYGIGNNTFSNFQRHGYGRDIPVLSKLHEAEGFKPDCFRNIYVK